jgi:hypothetical protein
VETPVEFLGRPAAFGEVNLLEEDTAQAPQQVLRSGPYAIKTIKLKTRYGPLERQPRRMDFRRQRFSDKGLATKV